MPRRLLRVTSLWCLDLGTSALDGTRYYFGEALLGLLAFFVDAVVEDELRRSVVSLVDTAGSDAIRWSLRVMAHDVDEAGNRSQATNERYFDAQVL